MTNALLSGGLDHFGVIRFAGPDAITFLQGQVSNDTRRLGEGRSVVAAYSSPQGRVLAVLTLLPHSSGVLAVLPRELVAPTLERLRKFVLRAKVTLEDVSEQLWVLGEHASVAEGDLAFPRLVTAGLDVSAETRGYTEDHGIGATRVGQDASRYWVVGAPQQLSDRGLAHGIAAALQVEHDWRLADIRAGLPQVYAATTELFVAQMLNLDLLDGISFTKGCYTGQEIIARTQHLGRIKRRMYRLALPPGSWAVGQPLRLSDGRAGRLTELAQVGEQFEALAVLTMAAASSDVSTADVADSDTSGSSVGATELPLPYSLVPA